MTPLKLLLNLVMPIELHIGGGGGDGGAQAEADRIRAEDSQSEYQIAQDKAKINALFGITDYDYNVDPSGLQIYDGGLKSYSDVESNISRLQELIATADADPEYDGGYGYQSADYSDTGHGAATSSWQDQLTAAQKNMAIFDGILGDYDADTSASSAQSAFDTREDTLEGIYGDIMGKYDFEQDRQYDRKSADIKAMLADRGLSRSTVGQSVFDRLGEIRDTNTTSFEEGASDALTRIRDADSTTMGELIAQIDAGGDYANARTKGLSDLTTNIENSTSIANARDLTNLFAGMDELYGQKQYVDAYNEGQRTGSSNIVTPGSGASSSGSVVNY